MTSASPTKLGLLARLQQGPVICAEGYVFELERRGYVQAGAFVPEVVLDHPNALVELHREFLHAGSDIIEALTYYAHREKLRLIDREDSLEEINRQALQLARQVADEGNALVAGNICNTNVYLPEDAPSASTVRAMFAEQVGWAADAGVDLVIAETIPFLGEAMLALEVIAEARLPSVVTLAIHKNGLTRDGVSAAAACKRLRDAGADVVGLNCIRGPETMLPLLGPIREAVDCPVAALPVPYRTTPDEPTFQSLTDRNGCHLPGDLRPFPTALDPHTCTRYEIAAFARQAHELGVAYLGVCCGAGPHHIRSMAEALGRSPKASKYSPDMSKHYSLGTSEKLRAEHQRFAKDL